MAGDKSQPDRTETRLKRLSLRELDRIIRKGYRDLRRRPPWEFPDQTLPSKRESDKP